jgi:hypothetical protein
MGSLNLSILDVVIWIINGTEISIIPDPDHPIIP